MHITYIYIYIYIYIYLLNLLVCFVLCYFFHLFERPLSICRHCQVEYQLNRLNIIFFLLSDT